MKRRKNTDENTNSDNDRSAGADEEGGQPRAKRPATPVRSPAKTGFINSAATSPFRAGSGFTRSPFGRISSRTPPPPPVSPVRRSPKNTVLYLPVTGKENEKAEKLEDGTSVVFGEMPARPLNPFFLYMAKRKGKLLSESKAGTYDAFSVTTVIAKEWKEMSIQKKRKWYIEAQKEKDRYLNQVKQKLFDIETVEVLDVRNNDKEGNKENGGDDDKENNDKNNNKGNNGIDKNDVIEGDDDDNSNISNNNNNNNISNDDKNIKSDGKSSSSGGGGGSSIRFNPSVTFI